MSKACEELYYAGKTVLIAGIGHEQPIKSIERIMKTYGGTEENWVKLSTKAKTFDEESLLPKHKITMEIHSCKNITTDQQVEPKVRIHNKFCEGEKNEFDNEI